MNRAYAEIPEGEMHYLTEGSGEPVVLLHQTPSSSEQYKVVIPLLATSGYRALAVDTLGYGRSDDPPREYEMADYARSIISFLDALGLSRAHVVGHYTGAAIAAEVGAAFPERVDKLVLSGCPNWPPEKWQAFYNDPNSPGLSPKLTDDGQFLMDLWQTSRRLLPHLEPKVRLRSVLNSLVAATKDYDAHHAVDRYDVTSRLPLIKSPTLLVHGSQCLFFDQREIAAGLIPRSRIVIIEGARGATPSQKPQEFAQAVIEFLGNPGV